MDGPIVNLRSCVANEQDGLLTYFDPTACKLLERVIKCGMNSRFLSDVKIVFISTWIDQYSRNGFIRMFASAGFNHIRHNIHDDYRIDDTHNRQQSIEKWLSEHPDVSHYVIVDDETYDDPNAIKVCAYNGISFQNYQEIMECFGYDDI